MKTRRFFSAFWLACAVTLMTGCSQDENFMTGQSEDNEVLNITAVSAGFHNVDVDTRATTDAQHQVSFENGDKMGLYAVSSDKIIVNNIALTYNAESQKWETEGGRRIYYYEGADYIAYYPYASIATPAKQGNQTLSAAVEAAIKASNVIAKNQSKEADFEAADLMMAKKTAVEVAGNKTLDFEMAHQNALIEFVLPAHKLKYPKAGKTVDSHEAADFIEFSVPMSGFELTSVGTTLAAGAEEANVPFALDDNRTYRMIVPVGTVPQFAAKFSDPKDNMPVTISETTAAIGLAAGHYKQYKVTKVVIDDKDEVTYPETAVAMDIVGSYLCSDGTILPYEWVKAGADASKAVAIIYAQVGQNDFANTDKANAGYNYYAIAAKAYPNAGFTAEEDGSFKLDGVTQLEVDDDKSNFYSKDDMSGYASTKALLAMNAGTVIKGIMDQKFKTPSGNNSGWFIASAGQWWLLADAANEEAVKPAYANYTWGQQSDGKVYAWMIDRIGNLGISTNNIGQTNLTITRCKDSKNISGSTTEAIYSAAWNTNKFVIGYVAIAKANSNRFIRPIIAF